MPPAVKKRRLAEIVALQNAHSLESASRFVGREVTVLVEGTSKRSEQQYRGRTDTSHMAVFDRPHGLRAGDYAVVRVESATQATLMSTFVRKTTLEAETARPAPVAVG